MTWHIHIEGQVQGVGFRPFVFLLAQQCKVNGWVNNSTDGVHIEINANEKIAYDFHQKVIKNAPILARVTKHSITKIEQKFFDNFQIIHSKHSSKANLLLTPDFALCAECKAELHTPSNRRNQYAFITCTNCGPRYSIIKNVPFDRVNTTMDTFQMCSICETEYQNPYDRRYFSQTNSCPTCKIELALFDHKQQLISKEEIYIIEQIVDLWEAGKIVAIKGIGGYLLTCDASNANAISALRKRKHRPSKPFALMFPDISDLEKIIALRNTEKEMLQSSIAPIVLLDFGKKLRNTVASEELAPNLSQFGILLPYTPLYELLLHKFGKPIIATSGNISNAPIVFQDQRAFQDLAQIADFILTNNRAIVVPQDDSVAKFSFFKNQKIILRRSRGLAPTYINTDLELPKQSILAMGAMLKSTFSLLHQNNTYVSQYLGDLENYNTQENYTLTISHFLNLLNTKVATILIDKHLSYPSAIVGKELATQSNIPVQAIQHHIAHFSAVLGEHNLIHTQAPILGVIWDGTGLGEDGQIWGGEFFRYENYDFVRAYHFDYFDFILGDKMPKEPRISALSACWEVMGAAAFLEEKFTSIEWNWYSKLLKKENSLQTSSVGRLFDAVASLLGILDVQTYEGEAAMRLEFLASKYFKTNALDFSSSYFMEGAHYYRIPTKTLMTGILRDLKKGKSKDFIAAKFHYSLVKIIKIVANNLKIKKIAFSGGVFQNSLLLDLIQHHLHEDFELFFHQQLSPNDENISFGQLVNYQIQQTKSLV